METYLLFTGTKPNGDLECMAILPAELGEEFEGHKSQPEDFFIPRTVEIKQAGEIRIEGDIHLLDSYFSVRS